MDDEFDKLMEFFSLDFKEKEKKLEDIFQKSLDFFDQYKYILSSGTEQEKAEMQKKMQILRNKIKEENARSQEAANLTPEEIKEITSDARHFTPKQWEFIQRAKDALAQESSEKELRQKIQKEERQKELKEKTKKRPGAKKSNWMKSWKIKSPILNPKTF